MPSKLAAVAVKECQSAFTSAGREQHAVYTCNKDDALSMPGQERLRPVCQLNARNAGSAARSNVCCATPKMIAITAQFSAALLPCRCPR
jgi:hypothetical protein